MKTLYMKQKVLSLNEKFSIKDQEENIIYSVKGSFLKIPKSFTMYDSNEEEIGTVTKELFKLLPKFSVKVVGASPILIEKKLSFFKANYHIDSENIQIQGDWLDKNYAIERNGIEIARINQKWLAMNSTYEISILEENYEHLIILLVAAIDFVKAEERAAASSSSV
ncbi:MAG: LURP-one-related family protein [Vagococcus sp.]|uniref:LURP-one-related/scramblase family protein n=1 Tax=Vagococcus sp. TaxID=1933889 RepID=UPI002FCA842A